MEKNNQTAKLCRNHQNPYLFYCFDDREFLCDLCFKSHKTHNLEIKADIQQKELSFNYLRTTDSTQVLDQYAIIKDQLVNIRSIINNEIENISIAILNLQSQEVLSEKIMNSAIFDLSYEEYNKIENIADKRSNINQIEKQISSILQSIADKTRLINKTQFINFEWIQSSILIKDYSPFHVGFPPEILLGKQSGDYYLSEGNKNHFIIFDLCSNYFVKEFKISVSNYECTVQNFTVSVSDDNTNFGEKKPFVCPRYSSNIQWDIFQLNEFGRYFRFDLIDNWGIGGGLYILINKIMFNASNTQQ